MARRGVWGRRVFVGVALSAGLVSVIALPLAADPVGQFTEFTVPTAGSEPASIAAGPDGNLWFTESASVANNIGRITPDGTFT